MITYQLCDYYKSVGMVLSFTEVPINWIQIFEQNLHIVRYVDCPNQMLHPTSRGRWDLSLIP